MRSDESYKIPIDGDWMLEDLYTFPKAYEQVYYLYYSLLSHEDSNAKELIQYAYSKYPWSGGYSAVNFYNKLKYTIPKKNRPTIISIQYASPGWIELSLLIPVALVVERVIKKTGGAIREGNRIYQEIYENFEKRKLLRIEREQKQLELSKQTQDFAFESLQKMATLLSLDNPNDITNKTGDPLKAVKILFFLYRRVRKLAEFQNDGKTML
jgi:hypothetical protein